MVLEHDDAPAVLYGTFEKFHDFFISIFEISELSRKFDAIFAKLRVLSIVGTPLEWLFAKLSFDHGFDRPHWRIPGQISDLVQNTRIISHNSLPRVHHLPNSS
jgi:hypothetical protein